MKMDARPGPSGSLAGIRALVVGLAREGSAVARFLTECGAWVTVTDVKAHEELAEQVASLGDLGLTYALGGHPLTLLDGVDIVFVSPGVPMEIPLLREAVRRKIVVSSETRLFTRLCPAPILAVTASSGKTTTTTLVGEMLKATGTRTWVGGNIGRPLIAYLDQIRADDAVVMELSSFQLDLLGTWSSAATGREFGAPAFDPRGWSPHIAGLLNITPNHLDRHPSMEAYIAAKRQILAYQNTGDTAVLGLDNPVTRQIGEDLADGQQVLWFSLREPVGQGAFRRGEELILRLHGRERPICRTGELKVLGRHNVANMLAAFALAATAGVPDAALRRVAMDFTGVEHRLELVREHRQVRWYNDSIATTPERTVAALRSFEAPIVLLAGGKDKNLPWDEMATLTWSRVRHLVLFGAAGGRIEGAMRDSAAAADGSCQIHQAGTLERAVQLAATLARPGDIVLLSPGGTSYDAYRDFVERGEHFRRLVNELE